MNNQNQNLLDTRRAEYLGDIKAAIEKLTAWVNHDEERTEYDWSDLGSLAHVVDLLQDVSEFIGDGE